MSDAKWGGQSIRVPRSLVITVRERETFLKHLEISLLLYADGSILVRRATTVYCSLANGVLWSGHSDRECSEWT